MTAFYKITISLPSRAAEHVKRAVKLGRAPSASAYITAAIEEKASSGTLLEMLDEMLEETGGPPTPEETRKVDRLLGIKKPMAKRTSKPKQPRRR